MLNKKNNSRFFEGLVDSSESQSAEYLPADGEEIESIIASEEMRILNDFLVVFHFDLERRFHSSIKDVEEYRKRYEEGKIHSEIVFTPNEVEMSLIENSYLGNYEYLAAEVALSCFFNRMDLIFKYFQYYKLLPTKIKPSTNAILKDEKYLSDGYLGLCLSSFADQGILSEEDLVLPSLIEGRSIRNKFVHGSVNIERVNLGACSLINLFKESKMIFDKISNKTKVQA